jgi:dUTP pyrophosphatase
MFDNQKLNSKLDQIYKDMKEKGESVFRTANVRLDVKFVNKSDNLDPAYETAGASGFDIRADLDESITLQPLERRVISTGLYWELPMGYELQVRPRSGLAAKKGITVLNSPGTIDADYRGELGIILVNLSNEPFVVNHGERIAQGVIAPSLGQNYYRLNKLDSTDEFTTTERGEGGFGSTGVK